MKSKKKWLEGLAALKLDMSKTYDIIECDFLRKMMIQLDFQERWVHLIMKCVTFVSYKIKINGSHTSCFISQHGLRQSDPLPPLLIFLFFMLMVYRHCCIKLNEMVRFKELKTVVRLLISTICSLHMIP
jgi:hypothetical protein